MKKLIIILIIILLSCEQPTNTTPAYFVLGQSNACQKLAEAIQENTNIPVYQQNHPGQEIENWYTNELHAFALRDADFIYTNGSPKAIFWFQGEQNCYDENTQDNYAAYTSNLILHFKDVFGDIDINIFKIGYAGINPEVLNNIDKIRAEQDWLASYYSGVIIDTQAYERIDSWHLTDEAYIQLGADIINLYEEKN